MSIGSSGRIVIEIEPDLKKELHSALKEDGVNLKSWFLDNVEQFLLKRSNSAFPAVKQEQGKNREI
ncbi:hypothetical protein AWR36_010520 [Microbulbifer flavimaris]|uniref:Toxin-antitoxin system HicB family antitoxin n=1 Tax=Microbulbifer flavimaris TaxID=1781068 RepID=A0ABX4HYE9_9GAMM|nr:MULTISPECIES: hypothetical protein [Microbulbifer]KUJ82968.1 hypothetical protein AVO43_10500 [Microbulbifer sp. ZGT114]PCO05152.1 hypothetical protein AWR36_010520 [Microbulbifer flavimaris]